MKKTKQRKPDSVSRFLARPEAAKAAELARFERGEVPLTESRPLKAEERKLWKRVRSRLRKSRRL